MNHMFMVWGALVAVLLIWVTPTSIFHIAFEQSDLRNKVFDMICSIIFGADVVICVIKREYIKELLQHDYFRRYILFDLVA